MWSLTFGRLCVFSYITSEYPPTATAENGAAATIECKQQPECCRCRHGYAATTADGRSTPGLDPSTVDSAAAAAAAATTTTTAATATAATAIYSARDASIPNLDWAYCVEYKNPTWSIDGIRLSLRCISRCSSR